MCKRWKPFHTFNKQIDNYGDTWIADSLNPMFRLVKYQPGNHFDKHEDGFFWQDWNKKTFATFMIYLNTVDPENGGATQFYEHGTSIQPREGCLCVFPVKDVMHQGQIVKTCKYLLRTDILYRLQEKDSIWLDFRKKIFKTFQKANETDEMKDWNDYFNICMDYNKYRNF